MKVNIGNYRDYLSAHKHISFLENLIGEDRVDKLSTYLQPIYNFCWNDRWWNQRRYNIKIHNYDVWSLDHTLAHIITPCLKELRKDIHGSPYVSDDDVPDELKSTNAEEKGDRQKGDIDSNHHKRWEYVLDEMIWAFEQNILEPSWEDQYYSGKTDFRFEKGDGDIEHYTMVHGPNHTFKVDMEGLKKHQERMNNGYRLFAKYYNNLWS